MKHVSAMVLLAILLCNWGFAQTKEPNNPILIKDPGLQIGGQIGYSLGDNEQPREINDINSYARVAYRLFLDFGLMERVRAQVSGEYAEMAGYYYHTHVWPIEGRLMYFPSYSPYFSPYLYAGVGALKYEIQWMQPGRMSPGISTGDWVATVPVGAGFVTQFTNRIGLDLNVGWNYISSDQTNGRLGSSYDSFWSAMIGVRVAPGKTAYERQQEEFAKRKAEQDQLTKDAELRAAEERRRKDLEAQKAADELKRKQEQERKELEAKKAEAAKKAEEAVKAVVPPPVPKPEAPKVAKPEIKFEPVYFLTGGANLSAAEKKKLNAAVKTLLENPDAKILVVGHTDNVGSKAINEKLSVKRADVVKKYLVGKGIAAERISDEAKSFDEPAASNDNAEGRQLNRRTELHVVK